MFMVISRGVYHSTIKVCIVSDMLAHSIANSLQIIAKIK